MRYFFSVFILLSSSLFGDLSTYFKPAINKTDQHNIRNIDFIYMINLDERPEKWDRSILQLQKYNIDPYRFSAVNGWELPLSVLNKIGVKYEASMTKGLKGTYFYKNPKTLDIEFAHEPITKIGKYYVCQCLSRGAIGIILSHLSVLQDAYDSGYSTIWVMEDDINVVRNRHELSEIIDTLDHLVGENGWDVLFTDSDTKGRNGKYVPCLSYTTRLNRNIKYPTNFISTNISPQLKKIPTRYGAYSMILRRSGIEKLLAFFKKRGIFFPYDIDYAYADNIRLYGVRYDIVATCIDALSDNGFPRYRDKK